jgi:hypothetical protein
MTFEQAMKKLADDKTVIEQALSDLQTAKGLNAMDETEKAVDLYASTRATIRRQFSIRKAV